MEPFGDFHDVGKRDVTTTNLDRSVIRPVHVYAQGKLLLTDAK